MTLPEYILNLIMFLGRSGLFRLGLLYRLLYLFLIQIRIFKITQSQTGKPKEIYTYDEAFTNYQLALGNAVVKKGRASEKAYLCLKMAWLLRGKMEAWDSGYEPYQGDSYSEDVEDLRQDELELLNNAIEGFLNARQSETFPMCGMDENTLDYIIAVSAMKLEKYDIVSQMLNSLLGKPGLNSRMKDMCIELKAIQE